MNKFQANNSTLAFERLGKGAPLVLIHGFPLDHSIWNEVTPRLIPTFDVILPDLRGFGESLSSIPTWSMTDLANDTAALLDHLGIESAFIAGHSMGGYVALAFARNHPRRVRGLALVASQTAADSPEKRKDRLAQAGQIARDGISKTVAGMTAKLASVRRVQKLVHSLMQNQKPAGLIGSLHAMAGREDTLPVLVNSTYPVLLIHGDSDSLIPIQHAREIQARVPRAQLMELTGLGHMPMMESSQMVADALKRFQ